MSSRIKWIFLFLFIISAKGIFAQGEAAVPFLQLAPDSRAGGLGESGTGLADNAAAVFWNPAGIAFLTGSEVSITHSNWLPQFNLDDLFYDYLAYRGYVESLEGHITASVTYMNFGTFVRTSSAGNELGTFKAFDGALTVGYATKIHNDWGLGFNFRVIHSNLSDKPTENEKGSGKATSVSFDIATMWRPEELEIPFAGIDLSNKFSLGINLSNLGPKLTYIDQAQADPIPTKFKLGMAFRLYEDEFNSLTYTIDFGKLLVDRGRPITVTDSTGKVTKTYDTKNRKEFYESIFTAWGDQSFSEELRDINTSMGIEYVYGDPMDFQFALRAGFFYEDPGYGNRKFVTFGAGIRYDVYGFDFGYITTDVFEGGDNHPLSDTMRFTLLINWDASPKSQEGFPRGY